MSEEHWYQRFPDLIGLFRPSTVLLVAHAVTVVTYGAHRAYAFEREVERNKSGEGAITLDANQALLIPVASSCFLLLIFYYFSAISQILAFMSIVGATCSVAFTIEPAVSRAFAYYRPRSVYHMTNGSNLVRVCGTLVSVEGLAAVVGSLLLVACWLGSGHWMLNNILGMCMCIAFVSYIRLPNMKVCAMLLMCLFCYDIFWVFASKSIFGANVMVAVATKRADNPVHHVASAMHIPVPQGLAAKLDLPVKLLVPRHLWAPLTSSRDFLMLGLGDMALPGLLLALALCFDRRQNPLDVPPGSPLPGSPMDLTSMAALAAASPPSPALPPARSAANHAAGPAKYSYLTCTVVGYTLGLIFTLCVGVLSQAAQPALLYLVPFTLIPLTLTAWSRKELSDLWNGPADNKTWGADKEVAV